ncbi:MAG: hypothetical protein ACYDCK_06320 [Thermoplasmatota archaeon]
MVARARLIGGGALVVFVVLSSFLGLAGRIVFLREASPEAADPLGLRFMALVWSTSLTADLIFAVGSVASAWFAFRVAGRGGFWAGFAFAAGGALLVYMMSFLALTLPPFLDWMAEAPTVTHVAAESAKNPATAAWNVWQIGVCGLVFAAFAPSAAERLLRRHAARASPGDGRGA